MNTPTPKEIIDRTTKLISKGWIQGQYFDDPQGIETPATAASFCTVGALYTAWLQLTDATAEMDQPAVDLRGMPRVVLETLCECILDEDLGEADYSIAPEDLLGGRIIHWNDSRGSVQEVIEALGAASSILGTIEHGAVGAAEAVVNDIEAVTQEVPC